MSTVLASPNALPVCDLSPEQKKRKAEELRRLTGSKIRIEFKESDTLVDDSESWGHVFSGHHAEHEKDWDEIVLDDRLDEPLEIQLVNQIREIAAEWSEIANRIEMESERRTG
jgi:hypothetical protein